MRGPSNSPDEDRSSFLSRLAQNTYLKVFSLLSSAGAGVGGCASQLDSSSTISHSSRVPTVTTEVRGGVKIVQSDNPIPRSALRDCDPETLKKTRSGGDHHAQCVVLK